MKPKRSRGTNALDLLLALRDNTNVVWSGRHRPALDDLPVPPRPQQEKPPLWLGVGGTPASIERAARLGLPMTLGLIGGDIRRARTLTEHYRTLGQAAGHAPEALRLAATSHFYVGATSQGARKDLYPYYREYLRPKTAGGRGWLVGPDQFEAVSGRFGALMTGSPQEVIDKILTEHELLGLNRFMGQIDFGGMPAAMVNASIELLATEVAPRHSQGTRPDRAPGRMNGPGALPRAPSPYPPQPMPIQHLICPREYDAMTTHADPSYVDPAMINPRAQRLVEAFKQALIRLRDEEGLTFDDIKTLTDLLQRVQTATGAHLSLVAMPL
ncbi:LLM class flavin-dependent oxidoreductase [Streptomyces sp. NPDC056121]|uniref:LLM class flavin-dependent oxidoreductase n=1 Tax=Streptomyces sp. NPDC056121 TaxID=3345718 RepID=UPI0035E0D7E3